MNAHEYLAAREKFGMKFGLDGIRALAAELGAPQDAFRSLLVAGTNGKGSVVAYVDAALRGSLRVGRYTSPHLRRVNERITVDGKPLDDPALDRCVGEVRDAAERLVRAGRLSAHPTYFEAVTAAAFVHFRAVGVEVAVLEVGMGGRLDATNVVEPVVSAIVTVERDHEAYLGHSLAAIAGEKAGILRAGRTTVLGPLGREAYQAVSEAGRRSGARVVDALDGVFLTSHAERLDVRTPYAAYEGLRPLPGEHQRINLVVALRLLEEGRAAGLPVDVGAVGPRISETRWPGRLQELAGSPRVLLDGAHNPAAALALARHLATLPPFVLLFAAMADKDVEALGRTLFPLATRVIVTRPRTGRAASPEEIVARVGAPAASAQCVPAVGAALALAQKEATPGGRVVVAGSLYLVGEVLELLGVEA